MENNAIQVLVGQHAKLNIQVQSTKKNTVAANEEASFAKLMESSLSDNTKVWDPKLIEQKQSQQAQLVWNSELVTSTPTSYSLSSEVNQSQFSSLIQAASQKYGVSEQLIRSVIQAESSFNPNATSSAGAKGLMQLMDGTAKGLGVTNSYDPEQNINGGTKYLAMLLQKYKGEEKVALAAYNAGLGRVDKLGIKTNVDFEEKHDLLPRETQNYVNKVLSYII